MNLSFGQTTFLFWTLAAVFMSIGLIADEAGSSGILVSWVIWAIGMTIATIVRWVDDNDKRSR
jgi:hypothetical protein